MKAAPGWRIKLSAGSVAAKKSVYESSSISCRNNGEKLYYRIGISGRRRIKHETIETIY